MLRYLLLFAVCVGISLEIYGQADISTDFVLPMKLNPVVSGSFGELRSNHFHSGLDLTTNGKTGYSVYASDQGSVSRIKVSSGGYGKALYIDHPSGHTTVYAHLERYAQKIDSIVKVRQYQQKSFEIELFFKKGELTVEKGEVVGYSGNSGSSGGPHLHYEVRDKATQRPTNPMFFRSDIKDDVRPQIQGVKLYPLSNQSAINGDIEEYYSPTVFYDGEFHPKGWKQVKAFGKIGIGVQVLDYLSDSWRKCGVSSIQLFANDSLIFSSEIDEFSFSETRYINAHIDYAEKLKTGKVIQRSYVLPNNRLSIYKKKNTYSLDVAPGQKYAMKYIIKDVTGNTSYLLFDIVGDTVQEQEVIHDNTMLLSYNKAYSIDTIGMKINIPSYAFYDNTPMLIHQQDTLIEGLLSPVYLIGDYHNPVHKYMSIAIPVPDSLNLWKDKLCIAGVTVTGRIFNSGGDFEDGYVTASIRNFGSFGLAIDTVPPKLAIKKAPSAYNYSVRNGIDITLSDDFSGIKDYECLIDGQWALFEYDGKNNLLTGDFKDIPLKKGEHQLLINVSDHKGNASKLEITFIR